jgi:DNA-binding NarL/FixJ family response regulator
VLLVEDSPVSQMAFTDLAAALGCTVLDVLARGTDATEWLQTNRDRAEAVVLDLLLLDGSAFGLIPRAKKHQPRAAVVVFSDFVTPTIAEKCRRLGADAVFAQSQVPE